MALYGAPVEYALHTLLNLGLAPADTAPSARDLAEFQRLPVAFMRKLLTQLAKAGLVTGSGGGARRLAAGARGEAISVLEVTDAVHGGDPLFECRNIRERCALWPDDDPPPGATSGVCTIHAVMLRAEAAMRRELARHTLADIAERVSGRRPRRGRSRSRPGSPGATPAGDAPSRRPMRRPAMTDKILIIGGGFAGFWAAIAARRVAGRRAAVTLVSREPTLKVRPRLYEAHPETLGVDLLPLLAAADVRFVQGEAAGLDLSGRAVELATGERLGYDRLVVATGSVMRRATGPRRGVGLVDRQPARGDGLRPAAGRDRRKWGAPGGRRRRGRLHRHRTGARTARPAVRSWGRGSRRTPADRADRPGGRRRSGAWPGAAPGDPGGAGRGPRRANLGATVTGLAADRVTFADGTILNADAVALATGLVAAPFVEHVPGERDRLGRVVVDRALRAPARARRLRDRRRRCRRRWRRLPDAPVMPARAPARPLRRGERRPRSAGGAAADLRANGLRDPLDLGRSGAVYTRGRNRTVAWTGAEAKARKRRINTQVIYPPEHPTGEVLLALSSVDSDDKSLNGMPRERSTAKPVDRRSRGFMCRVCARNAKLR